MTRTIPPDVKRPSPIVADTDELEILAEPETRWRLIEQASAWAGWRVRYRRRGERFWTRFVLEYDGPEALTAELLRDAVYLHASGVEVRRDVRRRRRGAS